MGASRFKTWARGSFPSLPLVAWSVRRVTERPGLSKQPLIEKPYRLNPKLPLYFLKSTGYGPSENRSSLDATANLKGGKNATSFCESYLAPVV